MSRVTTPRFHQIHWTVEDLPSLFVLYGANIAHRLCTPTARKEREPLFFWEIGCNGNRHAVDFLVVRPFADAAGRVRVSPVEVKSSGLHLRTRSLDLIAERCGSAIGTEYVLSPKPMEASNRRRVRLPLYMGGLL